MFFHYGPDQQNFFRPGPGKLKFSDPSPDQIRTGPGPIWVGLDGLYQGCLLVISKGEQTDFVISTISVISSDFKFQ
jgi:hypothetical protein